VTSILLKCVPLIQGSISGYNNAALGPLAAAFPAPPIKLSSSLIVEFPHRFPMRPKRPRSLTSSITSPLPNSK
jgi:hypothetical protein